MGKTTKKRTAADNASGAETWNACDAAPAACMPDAPAVSPTHAGFAQSASMASGVQGSAPDASGVQGSAPDASGVQGSAPDASGVQAGAPSAADQDGKMRIIISYVQAVELTDLTNFFSAVVNEYRRFSRDHDDTERDLRLCVHEIAPGSIKVDLALRILGGSLFVMSATNIVHDFCKNIVDTIGALESGKAADQGHALDKRRLDDYKNICVVIAKDSPGATISIGTVVGGDFNEMGLVAQSDARNVIGNIQQMQRRQTTPASAKFEKVLLYWDRINRPDENDDNADRDKAIVDDISDKAIKVNFDGDIKNEMLSDDKNFFKYAYLVDVTVKTVRGEPTMLIVNKYHDKTKIEQ